MKRFGIAVGVMLLLAGLTVLFATISQKTQTTPLSVNNQKFIVEIAKTSQKREQGLCCRDSLASDHGMLFVYDSPGDYRYWMKDTRIPLDIIWISSNKRIVHVEESVQPESYPESFGSDKPAQYVLELNAGTAKKYNFQNRDEVAFEL